MDSVVDDALRELAGTRHPRADAISQVAKKPGLYAFYGDAGAWADLQLTPTW